MLAANMDEPEQKIKQIIEKYGEKGWVRTQVCADKYAKDFAGKINKSEKTKFYRFCRQIGKGKVDGLRIQKLPCNISFIGLRSADPEFIKDFISKNKKISRIEGEDVHSVGIPQERLQQIVERMLEEMPLDVSLGFEKAGEDLKKHPIVNREGKDDVGAFVALAVKNSIDERENFKADLLKAAERVKIEIGSWAGETAPTLTDKDIVQLVTMVIRKIMDPNTAKGRQRPFKLIVSFPTDVPKS